MIIVMLYIVFSLVVPTTNASTVGKSETDGARAESPRRGIQTSKK